MGKGRRKATEVEARKGKKARKARAIAAAGTEGSGQSAAAQEAAGEAASGSSKPGNASATPAAGSVASSALSPRSHSRFEDGPLGDQDDDDDDDDDQQDDDDERYEDFYEGRNAFECVDWDARGDIAGFAYGFRLSGNTVPDAVLGDRAFARGFFQAPFEFVMDPVGLIRAKGLSPDISLRDLSARLQAAVTARMRDDGVWTEHGELDRDNEDAMDWASSWVDEGPGSDIGWCDKPENLTFGDAYWLARPFIEGYTFGDGIIYINSWGS
jgi:hypothetical protein